MIVTDAIDIDTIESGICINCNGELAENEIYVLVATDKGTNEAKVYECTNCSYLFYVIIENTGVDYSKIRLSER